MPRRDRRQREFERRDEELLAVARGMLGGPTWRTFTMAQLAEAADVAKGTVYLHVPSRVALLARLAIAALRPIALAARAAADGPGGTVTVLRRVLSGWLDAMRELPPADRRAIAAVADPEERRELPTDLRAALDTLDGDVATVLRGLLVRGIEEGLLPETRMVDRQLATLQAVLLGTRDQLWRDALPPAEARARLEEAVEFALVGLVGTRPESPLRD